MSARRNQKTFGNLRVQFFVKYWLFLKYPIYFYFLFKLVVFVFFFSLDYVVNVLKTCAFGDPRFIALVALMLGVCRLIFSTFSTHLIT